MIKKFFSKYFRKLKYKWKALRSFDYLSLMAILLSLITFYYQFFNVKHQILYSNFTPNFNNNSDSLFVPVFFKNSGNQTEVILNANLIMEVKIENEKSYFKRIADSNEEKFPIVLNSNEYKYIKLSSNYDDYLFGSLEINQNGSYFRKFNILDSLQLKLTTEFITKKGAVSNDTIDVGYITFNQNKKISRLDYNATKLRELNLNNSTIEKKGGSIINQTISRKVDLKNPKDIERNKAMLKYAKKAFKDSILNKALEKVE